MYLCCHLSPHGQSWYCFNSPLTKTVKILFHGAILSTLGKVLLNVRSRAQANINSNFFCAVWKKAWKAERSYTWEVVGFFNRPCDLSGPHLNANPDWTPTLFHIWMLLVAAIEVLLLEAFLHHTQLSLNFEEIILYVNVFLIILNWIYVCLSGNSQERDWERSRYVSLCCIYAIPVPWQYARRKISHQAIWNCGISVYRYTNLVSK